MDMGWSGAGWMDPAPMPEPVKRLRCLNCGGSVPATERERLETTGTHTDAHGTLDVPNNGIAFCSNPECLDVTLVEDDADAQPRPVADEDDGA